MKFTNYNIAEYLHERASEYIISGGRLEENVTQVKSIINLTDRLLSKNFSGLQQKVHQEFMELMRENTKDDKSFMWEVLRLSCGYYYDE